MLPVPVPGLKEPRGGVPPVHGGGQVRGGVAVVVAVVGHAPYCLLYTSDAADE